MLIFSSFTPHPYYLGVTDVKYNAKTQAMEISVKLFTNDLEVALSKLHKRPIDVINSKNKPNVDSLLSGYISARLKIGADGKAIAYRYIGYECESDVVWAYLESAKTGIPKRLDIEDKLLYDYLPQQINIVHTEINGAKQSGKVTNPDYKLSFNF